MVKKLLVACVLLSTTLALGQTSTTDLIHGRTPAAEVTHEFIPPRDTNCVDLHTYLSALFGVVGYTPPAGAICYDLDDLVLRCYNGVNWTACGSGTTTDAAAGNVLASNGSGGLSAMAAIQSQASGAATKFAGKYLTWDTDGDGSIDESWVADYDNDGTFGEWIDDGMAAMVAQCKPGGSISCTSGSCGVVGGTQRLATTDLDGDGTLNDPWCGTIKFIGPSWFTTSAKRWFSSDISGVVIDFNHAVVDYDDVACSELQGKSSELGLLVFDHSGLTGHIGTIELKNGIFRGYKARHDLDATCYLSGGLDTCAARYCPSGWTQTLYVLGKYPSPNYGKVWIHHNTIYGADRMGIRCQGANDCIVEDNTVDGAGEHAISVGHSNQTHVTRNRIRNSGQAGGVSGNGGDCIVAAGGMGTGGAASYNVTIDHNTCEDSAVGYRFERPAGATTPFEANFSINDNKCKNVNSPCVSVLADSTANSLVSFSVSGNQSYLGAGGGLDIEGNATLTLRGLSINDNQFYDISSGSTEYAIFGKYLQSSVIANNTIYDPNGRLGTGAAAGVINVENSDQIRVAGNIINGGDDAANNGHLIRLSTTTSSIVDGNILSSGADGSSVIDVASGNNNVIRGNRITMNATGSSTMYGIQAWEDRTLVEGNFVSSTRNGALGYRAEADYQTYANNMNELSGTGTTGLSINSTANNIYVNGGAFGQAGYAISEVNSSSGPTYIQGSGKSTSAASFRYNLANVASYFMDAAMGNRIERSCADAAAAATMTADGCSWLRVTGAAAAITTMNTCNAANKGRILTLQCDDASATVIGGGGNMTFAAFTCDGATGTGDTVVMQCDGSVWTAIAKTVN